MDRDFLSDYLTKINSDKDSLDRFIAALRGGNNTVEHYNLLQTIQLEDDWIIQIESAMSSLEQIVFRPRKFISENELLLDVSKVRRTTTKTVRHLSTHSQYVQNYEQDTGEVKAKKLLSVELEEDIAIYENRFICSLVNNLMRFVDLRNAEMKDKIESFNQTNIKMQSKFEYGGSRFTCNFDLKVDDPIETNVVNNEVNLALFNRIQAIRKRIYSLQTTEFMKVLNRSKPVRPPIQKTNLLMKNVDYNNCYKLWLYISSYRYLGFCATMQSKELPVDGDYYDDLTVMVGLSLQSMVANNILKREKYDAVEFSAPVERDYKVLNNIVLRPDFDDSAQDCDSNVINEYYYRQIKGDLMREATDSEFGVDNTLKINFAKFFRSVSRINDAMYSELIEDGLPPIDEDELNKMPAKSRQKLLVKRQKERVRRRKLFLKLKWEEVERAQRMLERDEARFYSLKDEYDGVRGASKSAKFSKHKFKKKKDE